MKVEINDFVARPISEIFRAIVDKNQLIGYFVSSASSDLTSGTDVEWEFADYGVSCIIQSIQVQENESITFEWEVENKMRKVNIKLSNVEDQKTKINITEESYTLEEIKTMMGQTQGWTDFSCSLKAYLYTGINLRNGRKAGD
jgi:uncharacterized protein YndB with AHSA1/START domain